MIEVVDEEDAAHWREAYESGWASRARKEVLCRPPDRGACVRIVGALAARGWTTEAE
jgi:hypothetical protein